MSITLKVSPHETLELTRININGYTLILYNGCYNGSNCVVRHILPTQSPGEIFHIEHPMLKLKPDLVFFNPVLVDGDIDTSGEFWVYDVPQKSLINEFSTSEDKTLQKHYIQQIAELIQYLNHQGISIGTIKLATCFVRDDYSLVIIALPVAKIVTTPSKNNNHLNSSLPIDVLIHFSNDITVLGYIVGYLLTGNRPQVSISQRYIRERNIYVPYTNVHFDKIDKLTYHDRQRVLKLTTGFSSKKMTINQAVVSLFTIFNPPQQEETIEVELDGTDCVVPEL